MAKHREKDSSLKLRRNPGLLRDQLFSSLDAAVTRKRGRPAGDGLRAEPERARGISGRSRFSLSPSAKNATTRSPAFTCRFLVVSGEATAERLNGLLLTHDEAFQTRRIRAPGAD
jgi:hypothetical protein